AHIAGSLAEAPPSTFAPLRLLVERDADYRASEGFLADREYWTQRFADQPEPPRLAARPARPARQVLHHTAFLPPAAAARLRQAARQARTHPSALLVAATAAYLHRMTGARDVILGLPTTARTDAVLRATPCMVSNVLPLRVEVQPRLSVSELVRQVSLEIRQALRHQRYRSENLPRDLGLPQGSNDLVATEVNIISFDYDLDFAGHRGATHTLTTGLIENLAITMYDRVDSTEGVRIDLEANPDLYSAEDLATHQRRLFGLLDAFTTDLEQPIGTINLLT
ncbi:condensation domain-containing protein, partial [Frankia sp. CiP1_Cm_nod2]|uniref:condensation domain-containing protein n=1 Tax=Frankia sp. CiP1_Cm_nod2 TaxID=2897161 RepID=UPI00202578C8